MHSDACSIHLTNPVLSGSGSFDGWYNEVIGFRHFDSKRGSFWFLGWGKGTCVQSLHMDQGEQVNSYGS